MLDVPSSPTALQYKYSFLSVSQLEGEDGPMCAQLLQHFKPNLEHLVQDTTSARGARPGTKRKVRPNVHACDELQSISSWTDDGVLMEVVLAEGSERGSLDLLGT